MLYMFIKLKTKNIGMTISNGTTDSKYIISYYWSAVTMAY